MALGDQPRPRMIGLIGGLSWESSAAYYRIINQVTRDRLGGLHSARCLLWSFDFHEVEDRMRADDWDAVANQLGDAATRLEQAGAELLLLCTNTMHHVADRLEARIRIPLLHIADPAAAAIRARGLQCVGLLGTAFTMEQAFFRRRLRDRFALAVLTPDHAERAALNRIVFDELVRGRCEAASRAALCAMINGLAARGAEAIILGCTELMLIAPADAPVPLFDTTALHATAAVAWSFDDAAPAMAGAR